MMSDSQIKQFLDQIIARSIQSDGKKIGSDIEKSTLRLGKDEKDAYIKDMVDRYKRGEEVSLTEEKAIELEVQRIDFMKEVMIREIKHLLGR